MSQTRYLRTTTARQTGTKVTTGHADDLGLDDGDGATRWYNVCEQHDEIIGHETLALAKSHASDPIGWCESCADLAAQVRAKAYAILQAESVEICNNCDAAEMVDGDPRGYCADCIAETDAAPIGVTKEWWAAIHRSRPIYINENGRHVCAEHIGHYARTFLQRRPNARIFQTATDHWIIADDFGIGCEDCGGGRSFR